VTYNFDPDKWCENERLRVEMKLRSGEMTPEDAKAALVEIERRYDAMLKRLDGTFQVGARADPNP
jgi:hypothetical protein